MVRAAARAEGDRLSPAARFCDEVDGAFGWFQDGDRLARTSHALAAGGGVWLVDPVDAAGIDERLRALGEPRGVVQLLDRHARDGAALAARLGVRLHEVPFAGIDGAPFEFVPIVRNRFWQEVALWWPERRVLVCADALGTVAYFRTGDERLGVHPLLRLTPPRRLARLDPQHVLVGHGPGIHGEAAAPALAEALATARRRLPRLLAALPRVLRRFG